MIEKDITSKGEIQLTDALAYVQQTSGMMAFILDGESFDIGNAVAYREKFLEF